MLGFSHVKAISVPNKSSMSFRFAKIEDKTEEELLLDAEARRADCSRGGRNSQKIRKQLNGLTQKLVNAKSSTAQDRALSNLVEALKVNSISGKKRGKSLQASIVGLIARTNKLDISGDIICSLSNALDVVPIVPRTKPTYADGRAPHPTNKTGRKQQINSATLKPGAKRLSDGREKGSGTKTIAQGRKSHKCKKTETAVQAKLDDPNLSVPQAMRKGGFVFPPGVTDSELTHSSEVIELTSKKMYKTLYKNFSMMKTRLKKKNDGH